MSLRGRILLGVAVVIGLVAYSPVTVHHRAKASVEAYRKQLMAQGEKLAIAEIAPR